MCYTIRRGHKMDIRPSIKITGPNMGLWTIVGIVFITLKLCGVIDWSWWFVLMPIYLPFGLFVFLAVLLTTAVSVAGIMFARDGPDTFSTYQRSKRR